MPEQPDYAALQARVSKLETRVEQVATDATAARHLAAANDRDYSDLAIKVDANRSAINALGVQTAARFDRLESRFDGLESRFDDLENKMRAGFAQQAAGQQTIVALLNRVIDDGQQP
jgi:outer membrane murein-binding lipoprotein Lpp